MPNPDRPIAHLPPTIAWEGDEHGHLAILDQTQLPHQRVVLHLTTLDAVVDAIVRLCVRGAPAIGVAAAYGLVIGVRERNPLPEAFVDTAREVAARLTAARPTAVNLQWALDRGLAAAKAEPLLARLWAEARRIHAEDIAAGVHIGKNGRGLVRDGATVLTYCNTGRLATAGDGTALAVLFAAWQDGVRFRVLAAETRPLLQGARLTALELAAAGIPVELVVDGAVAGLVARGQVDAAFVGADRIASNGDFANKVGTYGVALACAAHRVPFHVVAPVSTFDLRVADGAAIPIEERDATEVLTIGGVALAPGGVGARNPAFDVTPARLVSGFVTDRGILTAPYDQSIKALFPAGR